ncbi:tRNA (adenosine(37)-N6)-threonylcarbamoyltransferase complex dimerization subunit type 1 TsaB [Synechococcus sp. MIT S9451]|uniref:tRNA (adenosine(37)-N6)-threonylcarbamoyltransferase complex dimerization subunit type 1 TsaB n=1 Tax=Synechococcus sp. MIT S9451 TaxID=3082543 RepID=UPI0039B5B16D
MSRWLLALHSSTPVLGVAALDVDDPVDSRRLITQPAGRGLTNSLLGAVQDVLPAACWPSIARLAVAIGPGGFTGTRLTVVMARTLAQQLDCPLDGVSSFALMASRLAREVPLASPQEPFWIVQDLPRRGQVGGVYRLQPDDRVEELQVPHLLEEGAQPSPALTMAENVAEDVGRLLDLCLLAHRRQEPAPWHEVLPIYPTSPVGVV